MNEREEGTIAYYALGQLNNAIKNHKNTPIKSALVSGFGNPTENKDIVGRPQSEDVQNGLYKWIRPFNIIYSQNNIKAQNFASWLLRNDIQNRIGKLFIKLSPQQLGEMRNKIFTQDATVDSDLNNPDNYGLGEL